MSKPHSSPVPLDHAAIVAGTGAELKHNGRVVGPDGKTVCYLNGSTINVKAAPLLAKAPKSARLPEFKTDKTGEWARATVDNDAARKVLTYVLAAQAKAADVKEAS